MCSIGKAIGGFLGQGGDAPVVVREAPVADAGANADAANAKAEQDKLAARRRRKAASLLATGGEGDTSSPVTGMPSAQGKQQLGA